MTQEEKARRYDEAIKLAKDSYNYPSYPGFIRADVVFPELKESEDERIREEIIEYLERTVPHHHRDEVLKSKEWIAWLEKQGTPSKLSEEEQNRFAKGVLTSCAMSFINYLDAHKHEGKMCVSNGECKDIENAFQNAMWDRLHRYYCKYIEKQGEQKPVNKVEPKFKVGDWVAYNHNPNLPPKKIIQITDKHYVFADCSFETKTLEIDWHLWTIQDAKDGDVLITRKTQPFIFKNYDEDTDYVYAYCGISDLVKDNSFYIDNEDEPWTCCSCDDDVFPATKEQRDLLFQKIKEAGYEWDSKKKELKIIDWSKHIKYESNSPSIIEKNTTWSEEDERICQCLIEDQENALDEVRNDKYGHSEIISDLKEMYRERIDWLKSLKDRYTWKPSDEQMEALKHYVDTTMDGDIDLLYQDLKELKGE